MQRSPVRVLSLVASATLGGTERVLLDVVRLLDRTRYEPWVVLPSDGPLVGELEAVGCEVAVIDFLGRAAELGRYSRWEDYLRALRAGPQMAGGIQKVARLVQEARIQIIHSHAVKTHAVTSLLSLVVHRPIIWHIHDFLLGRPGLRWMALAADVVADLLIANSHAVASQFSSSSRFVVIHNGVDVEMFRPSGCTGKDEDQCTIGMVGAFAPWKGQHIFLQAAARVVRQVPRVRFYLIGDVIYSTAGHREYRSTLAQLVQDLGLEKHVVFGGFRRDIADVLSGLDIVVHCSIEPEPFGRVIVEAMACAKPVIASRAGGVREIISDGVNGLLVPPGDQERLAEALVSLVRDSQRRARLGEAARQRVLETFRIEDQVRKIEQCYERLL